MHNDQISLCLSVPLFFSHMEGGGELKTTPRKLLILLFHAWVHVEANFFTHHFLRTKSNTIMVTINMTMRHVYITLQCDIVSCSFIRT